MIYRGGNYTRIVYMHVLYVYVYTGEFPFNSGKRNKKKELRIKTFILRQCRPQNHNKIQVSNHINFVGRHDWPANVEIQK